MSTGMKDEKESPRGVCLHHSGIMVRLDNLDRNDHEMHKDMKEGFAELRKLMEKSQQASSAVVTGNGSKKSTIAIYATAVGTMVLAFVGIITLLDKAITFLKGWGKG